MSTREERLEQHDEKYRNRMASHAEKGNPTAKEWVEADQEAQAAENDIRFIQGAMDREPTSLYARHEQLTEAQDKRDEHARSGAPHVFQGKEREQWMSTRDKLNGQVDERMTEFAHAAEGASIGDIEELQKKLKERQAEHSQALDKRRSLGMMPSEAAQAQREDQLAYQREQQANVNDGAEADDTRGRPDNRGSAGRGYANYAASSQEENDLFKQQEANERRYRDAHLGEGVVTLEQVDQWIKEQEQEQGLAGQQAGQNQQDVQDEQQGSEVDTQASTEARPRQSMSEMLAARRSRVGQEPDGDLVEQLMPQQAQDQGAEIQRSRGRSQGR